MIESLRHAVLSRWRKWRDGLGLDFGRKFWSDAIDFVQEKEGPQQFGFWQIVTFAWLCNGAMHFGMADLSIFRFAKSPNAGWAPSIGMFLGHYMAWIAAALLLAAQIKLSQDHTANPGALAWGALGWTGILCVVIAGWTTANPTIYRAGLAFQGVIPMSSRTLMTLVAGAVATVAGAFQTCHTDCWISLVPMELYSVRWVR